MKKILLLFICIFSIFGLTACNLSDTTPEVDSAVNGKTFYLTKIVVGLKEYNVGDTFGSTEVTSSFLVVSFTSTSTTEGTGTLSLRGASKSFSYTKGLLGNYSLNVSGSTYTASFQRGQPM